MRDLAPDAHLVLQALEAPLVRGQSGREELQGDRLAEAEVVGAVDLAHAALAERRLDWSARYAGRSFAVLFFFVALLVAAFYTSLGGKPLFGRALFED